MGILGLQVVTPPNSVYPQNIQRTPESGDILLRAADQTACKPGSVPPGVSRTRRPFLWTAHCWAVLATYPNGSGGEPCPGPLDCSRIRGASFLFGLAPGGACHAASIAGDAVRSYRTLSPLPSFAEASEGGLLSVALSLGSPPAGVTRRLFAVEPGLSSLRREAKGDRPAVWSAWKVRTCALPVKRPTRLRQSSIFPATGS